MSSAGGGSEYVSDHTWTEKLSLIVRTKAGRRRRKGLELSGRDGNKKRQRESKGNIRGGSIGNGWLLGTLWITLVMRTNVHVLRNVRE